MQSEPIEDSQNASLSYHSPNLRSTLQHGLHHHDPAAPDGSQNRILPSVEKDLWPENGESDADSPVRVESSSSPTYSANALSIDEGRHDDSIAFNDVSLAPAQWLVDGTSLSGRQKRVSVLITDLPNGTCIIVFQSHKSRTNVYFKRS